MAYYKTDIKLLFYYLLTSILLFLCLAISSPSAYRFFMFALCIAYVFLFAFLIDFYGKLYYKITDKGITISFFDYSCFIPFNEIEKIEKVERVFPLTRFVLGGEVVYSNLGAVNLYSLNYFGNFILITLKCGLKYAVLPIEEDNFIKELSRRLT